MTIKRTLQLAACLGACVAFSSTAHAYSSLLLPITGAAFTKSHDSPSNGIHLLGAMQNPNNTPLIIEASLGRHAGLAVIQIFGMGNGGTTICQVLVNSELGVGSPAPFTGSKTANGPFQLNIVTGFNTDNTYYSVKCQLPPVANNVNASIFGVAADR